MSFPRPSPRPVPSGLSPQLECLEGRVLPSGWTPGPQHRALAIGSDSGVIARTWSYSNTQAPSPVITYQAADETGTPVYESTFRGGVRVVLARHFDPLGGTISVYAPGPGRTADIKVVVPGWGPHLSQQGYTTTFTAFESTFTGGAFVTVADFGNSGARDVVVTPDEGGGPRVRIYRNEDPNTIVADFFGIEDSNFRGGARTAVGDVNGDGTPDLVVAAGFGGGPRIAVWDGTTLQPGVTPRKLFNDFFVFEQTLRNGVYVACADIDGDGFADVIAGGGPGGGPRVFGVSGQALLTSNQLVPVANFFAADSEQRGGVRLAVKDIDGDNRADLVTGSGAVASAVVAYSGVSIPTDGLPTVIKRFEVHEPFTDNDIGFRGGVFVG